MSAKTSQTDLAQLLLTIQVRHLVTELCKTTGHSRWWFYRVLKGEAGCIQELAIIRKLIQNTQPVNVVAIERETASLRLNRIVDQAELAELVGVSRQTISLWEQKTIVPHGIYPKVHKALSDLA